MGDYETMARALATIGATDSEVDFKSFARDLEAFFAELESINSRIVIENNESQSGPGGLSAAVEVDQTQLNRLFVSLVRIGEKHGIKFPREFGLFLKQILYFDRYTRILAPSLQVFNDERINVRGLTTRYGVGQR
jgi:aarF domain-containing kinase